MRTFPHVLVCGLLALSISAAAQDAAVTPEALASLSAHPRLFFKDAEKEALATKIAGDPLLNRTYQWLLSVAPVIEKQPVVEYQKTGKRLLTVSRTCVQRVSYLAFVYRMTGDEAALRHAEQEMLAAAAFKDWNPSHFLDVAEMTTALAIGYDWLYDALPQESRTAIRDAIVNKGLKPSLEANGWVDEFHNWNQVCHGGMVVGALAVAEDEPALAAHIIQRAIENVPRALEQYEPDGVYPEGPAYWDYGTSYNVLLVSALESTLGNDFGLAPEGGFLESPTFLLHATGPSGKYFNFSDCSEKNSVSPAVFWFAARLKDPSLLSRQLYWLEDLLASPPPSDGEAERQMPFLLLWADSTQSAPMPEALNWKGDGPTPVALFRSGWEKEATFVGFKGGSPSTNHAHMDIGSFVMESGGVRWAVDLGMQDYNGLESRGLSIWNKNQDGDRWKVFRLNNYSHNTLVVDGRLQQVRGMAPIVKYSGEQDPFAIVDMAPVYEGQLEQAKRGVRLLGKAVLIQDEIQAVRQPCKVRWGMATRAAAQIVEDGKSAQLAEEGQSLEVRILAPEGATLTLIDMEAPAHDYDQANPNTRMLAFEVPLEAAQEETLAVFLQPGEGDVPTLSPLASW